MNLRPALTYALLWLFVMSAIAAGVLVGSLLATTVAASREAERADLPILPGRMTTEPSLPSPDSSRLRERPEPVALRTAAPVAAVRTPSPSVAANPRPTATTHRVAGTAAWYDYVPGGAAAGPALRRALGPDWRHTRVRVSGPAGSALLELSDWCGCSTGAEKLIDLDDAAFVAVCGPLSRGVCEVTVSWK